MLNEANIIAHLKAEFPEQIGDDAAIFPYSQNQSYVVTTDLLVQDIHFNLNYSDPVSLAHKALQVNLSDIAAMGATPQFVLLGLSIPTAYENQLAQFLPAFTTACKEASVLLIGGDTTKSPDKFFISVTVIGIAENAHLKYRHNATANDVICLAGNLGYAHLGLSALEASYAQFEPFKEAFLMPKARMHEGQWFGQQLGVNALMDISDGLFIDLQRLCQASRVAAEINLNNFQPTSEFVLACQQLNLDPLITQLTGGEDYALLITVQAGHFRRIATLFESLFAYPLKPIGLIKTGSDLSFIKDGHPVPLQLKPFSHFGELS